jgi:methionine sulfoxide reductase heme-binding subunit
MVTATLTAKKSRAASHAWLHPAVVTGGLAPAVTLAYLALRGALGANPVAEVLNQLGLVALVLLVASLACTPLRIITGWTWTFRLRRTLGLLGFTYATLHLCTYAGLDQLGNVRAIWNDVTERKFIFVGFAAFLCLVPLALTSTAASIKRIGAKNWKRLHRLAYVAAVLGVIHFVLRVKAEVREPLIYGGVLTTLLTVRIGKWHKRRLKRSPPGAAGGRSKGAATLAFRADPPSE